jgi:hypothetical protein
MLWAIFGTVIVSWNWLRDFWNLRFFRLTSWHYVCCLPWTKIISYSIMFNLYVGSNACPAILSFNCLFVAILCTKPQPRLSPHPHLLNKLSQKRPNGLCWKRLWENKEKVLSAWYLHNVQIAKRLFGSIHVFCPLLAALTAYQPFKKKCISDFVCES